MIILWLVLAFLLVAFGAVLLFGAPYLPTRRPQAKQALDLLDLKKGQVFYDLGCGDGRMVRLAARRGLRAVGYELNPVLFGLGWLLCLPVPGASVRFGNFWQADISDANGVFIFLLGRFMPKLDKFMRSQKFSGSVKLASYAFKVPGQTLVKRSSAMFLYVY